MEHTILLLTVLRVAALLCATVFLFFTGRAWLRTRSRGMATLFVAVGLLAAGVLAEGAALQGLGLSLDAAHLIESVFLLAGFLVLMLSVLVHRPGGSVPVDPDEGSYRRETDGESGVRLD